MVVRQRQAGGQLHWLVVVATFVEPVEPIACKLDKVNNLISITYSGITWHAIYLL